MIHVKWLVSRVQLSADLAVPRRWCSATVGYASGTCSQVGCSKLTTRWPPPSTRLFSLSQIQNSYHLSRPLSINFRPTELGCLLPRCLSNAESNRLLCRLLQHIQFALVAGLRMSAILIMIIWIRRPRQQRLSTSRGRNNLDTSTSKRMAAE